MVEVVAVAVLAEGGDNLASGSAGRGVGGRAAGGAVLDGTTRS